MSSWSYPPLFKGAIANGTTKYVPVPIHNENKVGQIGVSIGWPDAVSSAAITLEYSNLDVSEAPYEDAGSADQWIASGIAIDGPAAAAIGGVMVAVAFAPYKRARLKIVTAANTIVDVRDGLA